MKQYKFIDFSLRFKRDQSVPLCCLCIFLQFETSCIIIGPLSWLFSIFMWNLQYPVRSVLWCVQVLWKENQKTKKSLIETSLEYSNIIFTTCVAMSSWPTKLTAVMLLHLVGSYKSTIYLVAVSVLTLLFF